MTDARITLRFDGGSRGNPGPAAVGVVLEADDGTPVFTLGKPVGSATNNVAEYKALIEGLRAAQKLGVKRLRVLGDSELVIRQLLGQYKVKNETLKPLFEQATRLLAGFALPEIGHNTRGHNSLADALADLALDTNREVSDADLAAGGISGTSSDDPAAEETYDCPRCGCHITLTRPGHPPAEPKPFKCRCGTPMRAST
jgi:ribonuclease HI